MIISESVEIVITNNLRKYYTSLGYEIPKLKNSSLKIKIEDLHKGSNVLIDCKCDICEKINNISYYHYNKNIQRYGYYSCHGKCSREKFKTTNNILFGSDNPFQNENIKNKSKETLLKTYNVDNISKLEIVKNNHQKRNLEKYGVSNYFESDEFKTKSIQTNRIKYDCDNIMWNENFHIKQQISGFHIKEYNNIYYRGSYELDFLEKYFNFGIIKPPSIRYSFNNENKIYYPDFFIPKLNLIVEIKSNYTLNFDLKRNLEKQKACIDQRYNFIFIIDKDYTEFEKLIHI